MATNVHLTPELESFARNCVEDGKFNNVSEVVRAALRLLQENEKRRAAFDAMLDAVREEVAQGRTRSIDEVDAEMKSIIQKAPG
ncbi:MAG: type II toxin-antitoxin system ParD family antitoxin [Magnetovibrionaceae bacterium]